MEDKKKKRTFAETPHILNDSWVVDLKAGDASNPGEDKWLIRMQTGDYADDTFFKSDEVDTFGCEYYCDCRVGYYESEYLMKLIAEGQLDGENLEQIKLKLKEFAFLDATSLEEFKSWADEKIKKQTAAIPQINKKTPGSSPVVVMSKEGSKVYHQPTYGAKFVYDGASEDSSWASVGNLRFVKSNDK